MNIYHAPPSEADAIVAEIISLTKHNCHTDAVVAAAEFSGSKELHYAAMRASSTQNRLGHTPPDLLTDLRKIKDAALVEIARKYGKVTTQRIKSAF